MVDSIPIILSIDTSGDVCAIALDLGGGSIHFEQFDEPRSHAARLVPMIRDLLLDHELAAANLDTIVVAGGPGSYTGLRIGVSAAKGLAFAAGCSLASVPTLEAMVIANTHISSQRPLLTALPSRRGEVYAAVWTVNDRDAEAVAPVTSLPVDESDEYLMGLGLKSVTVLGAGADRMLQHLKRVQAFRPDTERSVIEGVVEIGRRKVEAGLFEDLATFEPHYLREFVAKVGKSPFDRLGQTSKQG